MAHGGGGMAAAMAAAVRWSRRFWQSCFRRSRVFAGARFGHFDHGRFGRFDHDRFVGFRRHFFFAGVGPGFYDWPYDDYNYGNCRVLTPNGWVWAC